MSVYDKYLRKVEFSSEDLSAFMTTDRKEIERNIGRVNEVTYDADGNPRAKLVKRAGFIPLDNFTASAVNVAKAVLARDGSLVNVDVTPEKGRRLGIYDGEKKVGTILVAIGTDPRSWEQPLPNGDRVWDMEKYDWQDFDDLGYAIRGGKEQDDEEGLTGFADAVSALSQEGPGPAKKEDMIDKETLAEIARAVRDPKKMAEITEIADAKTLKELAGWLREKPNLIPNRPPQDAAALYHYQQPVIYKDPEAAPTAHFGVPSFTENPEKQQRLYGDCEFAGHENHEKWGVVNYDTDKPLGMDEYTTTLKTVLKRSMEKKGMICVGNIRLTSQELVLQLTNDGDNEVSRGRKPDAIEYDTWGEIPKPTISLRVPNIEPDEVTLTEDDLPKDGPSGPGIDW